VPSCRDENATFRVARVEKESEQDEAGLLWVGVQDKALWRGNVRAET
jgi:hypothetical protein